MLRKLRLRQKNGFLIKKKKCVLAFILQSLSIIYLTPSSVLSSGRVRNESFPLFDRFSNLISGLRQVLQRQVSHVIGFGHLMFDGIFLAEEEKNASTSIFFKQNLMYKVLSDDILYLVGTFSPFSDVTVFKQGLTLETSSI